MRASPFRRNAAVTLTAIRPQFNRPPCGYWLSSNFDECESPERIRLHIGSSSILSVRPRRIELELRILLHNIAVSTMLTSSRCVVAPESSSRVFNGFSSVEPSRTRDVRTARGAASEKTTPALYSFLRTSHSATTRASARPSKLMSPVQMIETCGKVSHEARMSLDTLCLLAKPTSPVLIALGFVIPALSRAVRGFRREFC